MFFDNLTIHHNRGPILEETHYYPFGLSMAGISDQAMLKPENRFKYNGIELNHKEFSDGSGLELYTAQFRGLDPQIGRWWQVDPDIENGMQAWSPYASNYDNPIRFFDPLGNDPNEDCCGFTAALNDIKTGEKIAGVAEIAGGGPEDPVADAVAGAVEVGTFVKAGFDFFTRDDKPVVQVKAEGKQEQNRAKKEQTGSYTNEHESGKKYHGKGPEKRANQSAKEKASQYKDPVKKTDWKPAKNDREAFKDEAKRIRRDKGVENPNNYNKHNSPGEKYLKQDNSQ